MSAGLLWVRLDLQRRARSLVVLAVLVGLTTAVVLTAIAGARRGQTTVDRLIDRTSPATIAVLPNQPGFDWDAVAAIDGVAGISQFPLTSYVVDGIPEDSVSFIFDEQAMDTVERPVVLEGRLADPSRDDEAVITASFVDTYGKGVGDHVTLRLYTPEQIDASASGTEEELGKPEGPAIDLAIVGVVRSPWFSDYGDTTAGAVIPSAGVLARHREDLTGHDEQVFFNALVRLEDGVDGVPAFRERLAEVTGRHDIEFFDLGEDAQHARDVADFEADGLLVFAAAAGIAALFLVGQSVVRFVSGATPELEVLRAIGLSPRHVRWVAAAGPALAAVVGALAGATIAWFASSRFPMGTVRPLEPAPGRDLDLAILGGGALAVVLCMTAGALLASWMAAGSYGRVRVPRPSRVAGLATRAGAPVPTAIGTRFALERGSGSSAVPVLPAIVGSIIGVLGIVGALTFADGIDDATSHPERFGVFAQLETFVGFNGQDDAPSGAVEAIAAVPGVASVNDDRSGVAEIGTVDTTLFTIDPVGAPPPIVLTKGQLPANAGEVVLAPTSAEDLGVEVGDTVTLTSRSGRADLVVTGLAFVPEGPHNAYDEGAWVTRDGFDALSDSFKFHFYDITVEDGADVDAVAERINTDVPAALGLPEGTEVATLRTPPSRLGELKQMGRLPLYLAGFLALLAITAVGHAVATAVRRRRHDIAVLRAIGLTRGQTRRIALVQATVLALIGLIIGVPLGVALGRSLWRSVADSTPVLHIEPLAVLALLLIAPVAIALANVLAAWPSQRAARLHVGHVLRTE